MAWDTSTRRMPPNWAAIRESVLRRDRRRCQWIDRDGALCGRPANEVDHKVHRDDHRPESLWSLCHDHHARKTAREAAAARAAARREVDARLYSKPPHPSQQRW